MVSETRNEFCPIDICREEDGLVAVTGLLHKIRISYPKAWIFGRLVP